MKCRRRLFFGFFEHGVKFLDLAIAFVEAGAHSIPDHLFLFGHRTFDDDLARVHVDDDVVRVEQGLRNVKGDKVPPKEARPTTSGQNSDRRGPQRQLASRNQAASRES